MHIKSLNVYYDQPCYLQLIYILKVPKSEGKVGEKGK